MADHSTHADPFATRDAAADSPSQSTGNNETATLPDSRTATGSGSGRLEVRCPNCHAPTEVATDSALTELVCSCCGSNFSLVDNNAASRQAPSLAKMGRFELISRVGMGAFGSVWKARDKFLDRTVAIKIPRQSAMSVDEQEKFFREARTAAQLRHPNIVSVHEVGRDGDSLYIVSDFVHGVTLGDWLTGQQLTSREAAELCAKIAAALHHAHEQGIIHRDLKPANVMIDAAGEPHLMDFGLARREVGEITVTTDGQVLGTPAYMSPEQAQGESHSADARSDVYSLGVILFQLLTGELPFRGNARMVLHQVINDEPPSPRKLNANVAKDLETITLKCLEKDPARRYPRACDVTEELRRFLAGKPIQARPIGRIERGWRWAKLNRRIALLTTSVGVLLVTIALGASVAAVRISTMAAKAEEERQNALDARKLEAEQRKRAQESEARAKDEAQRATGEAEKARQVSAFLAEMFQESAPFSVAGLRFGMPDLSSSGGSLTAREILDRGAQRVDSQLKSQPLVQAALKDAVGNVYLGLGIFEKAEPLLQQALALRQGQLPHKHLDVAASMHSLGMLHLAQGRYADSADAVREAFEIRQSLLGDDSELVEISRRALVTILTFYKPTGYERDTVEALKLSQQSVAWSRSHLGNGHPETAIAMLICSGCLLNRDRPVEAALLIAEAEPILLRHESTSGLGKAISHFQRGVILGRMGLRSPALSAIDSGLELARKSVDNRHPLMTIARRTALGILLSIQETQRAQLLCEENISQLKGLGPSFELCEAKGELAHVLVVKADRESILKAGDLATEIAAMVVQIKQNPPRELEQLVVRIAGELTPYDTDRAAALWRAALPLAKASIAHDRGAVLRDDSDPGFLLEIVLNFAALLQSQGKQQEALELFANTMPEASKSGDDYVLMRLTEAWARLLGDQNQSAQAEQHYRQSLQFAKAFRQRIPGQGAAWTGTIMSEFSQFLSSQKRFQEAEKLNRECLPLLLEAGQYSRGLRTASQLGPEAVNQVIASALAHRGEKTPRPSDTLMLGELRLIAGKRRSAEAAIRAAIQGNETDRSFQKSLGWCLLAQENDEAARTAFQEALKDRRRGDGTYDLEKADPDQTTTAYFLDLIPEEQYVARFAGDEQLAFFPLFYVAQRREIEGNMPAAIEAYERCVSLGAADNPNPVRALAEWRLRELKEAAQATRK
jgi:regulator of protease activity HflC (stomatin/prohibitin superfamily)